MTSNTVLIILFLFFRTNDLNQYIQVDIGRPIIVTGVATQGRGIADHWVQTYNIKYAMNDASSSWEF